VSYYLPDETTRVIEKHIRRCKNLGLILDKYPTKISFEKPTKEDKQKGKTAWLLSILEPENPNNTTQNNHTDPQLSQNVYDRWMNMIEAMGAELFNAKLDWRMVVGLGGETVLETDLTLHHVYGIPYIPGSALKGLTRAYVAGEKLTPPSTKIEDDDEQIKRIFGSKDDAGKVIFFDAMPLNGQVVYELDIMNPHYPKYYGENALPTNDQDPNPITFLTVANTTFTFALAPRNSEAQEDVNKTREWLQEALEKYGVGGKTSAGYGYFKKPQEVEPSQPSHSSQSQQKTEPTSVTTRPKEGPRRIELPPFRENQEVMGEVAIPSQRTSLPQGIAIQDADKVLLYRDSRNVNYNLEAVVIIVNAEYSESQNWKEREQRRCQILRIEKHGDLTVLVCKPVQSKFGDKKKRS
jgi:CRISPR-associated protein Cmr6